MRLFNFLKLFYPNNPSIQAINYAYTAGSSYRISTLYRSLEPLCMDKRKQIVADFAKLCKGIESLSQTEIYIPYIFDVQCRRPLIFHTINFVRSNHLSLKETFSDFLKYTPRSQKHTLCFIFCPCKFFPYYFTGYRKILYYLSGSGIGKYYIIYLGLV